MKRRILLLCLILNSTSAIAFLNIEALRQSKVSDGLSGSTRLDLNQQKGNVDKTVLSFSTLNQYKKLKSSFLLMAAYQYGESFSELDNRRGHLHFRYTYALRKETFLEFFQQSEFNKFQDLKSRLLIGGGLRQELFKRNSLSFFSGLGLFYEKEKIEGQRNLENPRGNLYLSFLKELEGRYSISSTFYYQPNIERLSDSRVRFSLGLETTFAKNFTQSIEFSLNRDSLPPTGINRTDSQISAGLGVRY
jgi:hypothetical protein